MVARTGHGGNCCGMLHIHGFGNRHGGGTQEQDLEEIDRTLRDFPRGYTYEIVLSNMQYRESPILVQGLADRDFVLVNSFNGQHGTPVHVFHKRCTRAQFPDYPGQIGFGARVNARHDNRVLVTEYYASFQNGNRNGPFESLAALRQRWPRVVNYVKREIWGSGADIYADPRRIPRNA